MAQKVVFLGSKSIGFNTFQFLIDQQEKLGIELVGLLTKQSTLSRTEEDLENLANENGVPVLSNLDELLDMNSIDFLISVQYHEILKSKHIQKASKLAVNLHMAPVPEFRGCNQFSFAIVDGVKEFGTTLHVMSEGIDSGDILFEKRFPLAPGETAMSLQEKTLEFSYDLFSDSIKSIFEGDYKRTPQNSFAGKRAFGFHTRNEIDTLKQIELTWSEEKIDAHIRATYFPPFPPPFAFFEGKKIDLSPNWKTDLSEAGVSFPIQ